MVGSWGYYAKLNKSGGERQIPYAQFHFTFVVVQSLSHVWLFATPWFATHRLPCPSLSPRVCSNSCPLGSWCYLTISSSATPFSSCLQSFPASGSFPMSQLFASGGQSTGASASASVLPMNIQGWFHFNHLFKEPISKDSHILRSWGPELQHMNWGGDTIQGILLFSHSVAWCPNGFFIQWVQTNCQGTQKLWKFLLKFLPRLRVPDWNRFAATLVVAPCTFSCSLSQLQCAAMEKRWSTPRSLYLHYLAEQVLLWQPLYGRR